jgi:DNA-binding transcriptional LysR family regulator
MRRLEERIGEPVFERLGRGVRLTPTGAALLPAAEKALALAQEADALWSGLSVRSRGVVRLAASTTIAGYVVPAAIARFREAHADAEVEVRVGNTADVAAQVVRGDLAWGLVEGPVDTTLVAARAFMHDELILIAPARHPWARRASVSPEDLADVPFIGREPGSGTGAIYDAALAASGVRIRPQVHLAHSRGIVDAVAQGAGVSIVSALVAAPQLSAKRIARVRVRGLDLRRPFSVIHLPGRSLPALDREFLRAIRG